MDMTQYTAAKSDQLNSDDLIAGPRTITITKIKANEGNKEQPVNIFFEGDDGKPYRPCLSMRRVMIAVWGRDATQYVGRSMTIYRDPSVTWGGMEVGGIRISNMSGMEQPMVLALTATKKARKPYRVLPLVVEAPKPAEPPQPAKRGASAIIASFAAVVTAQDYYDVLDNDGERIAWLKANKPDVWQQVEDARKAAAERMQDTPVTEAPAAAQDDEVVA